MTTITTDLFLIRHGETEWNREGRMQGHGDSPLTEQGRAQARAIGLRLAELQPQVLVCSDLGRARATAALVAEHLGLAVEIHPGLRERNLGIFEGLTLAEAEARHPEAYRQWRAHDPAFVIPGGESVDQRTARVAAACLALVQTHAGKRIAAITHGGCLDSMIRHVLHIPPTVPRAYKLANAAFNHFRFTQNRWLLLTWGDTRHVDRLPIH
jgi:probable phosphoglycerate mutase